MPNRYGAKLPKYRRHGRGVRPAFNMSGFKLRPSFVGQKPPGAIGFPPIIPIGIPLPGASLPGMSPMMPLSGVPGVPGLSGPSGMYGLPGFSGFSVGSYPMSMLPVGFPSMVQMMPPSSVSLPVPSSIAHSRPSRAPLSGPRAP